MRLRDKGEILFKITSLNQNHEHKKVISSGITFGFKDLELVFKLEADGIEEPLLIYFYLKDDKNKDGSEFEIGSIKDNILKLFYYNPPKNGSFGITLPTSIITVGKNLLAIMFIIEPVVGSPVYKFSYEFYHGIKENEVEGE